MITSVRLQQNG